jgi:alpha-methylacyl-CoA racemase
VTVLQAVKVIELAAIGPVPMCGMLLADLGADVIRIDRVEASGLGLDIGLRYDVHGRGRRSIAVDLKQRRGRDLVLRLVEGADVLMEGFRPGVVERLGLGPNDCTARNSRLVYARMTGFGQTGELASAAGHDLNYIALSGALHAIGQAGSKPVPPLNLIGDYGGGGLYLALGILAALVERQSSGRGQVVDAAMVDGASSLMSIFYGLRAAGQWSERRGENVLDGGAPYYDVYATADGKYVSVAAIEPKFFAELARRIGLEDDFLQRQNERDAWPALRARLTQIFAAKTRDAWCDILEGSDACFAPVLEMGEAPAHRHNATRGVFVQVDGVTQPAPAPRFDRTPNATPRPPPRTGEHAGAILQELGFGAAEIAELRAAGVVA